MGILDELPEIKFFMKCGKCGANDWSSCNMTPDNRVVTNCNKCSEVTIGGDDDHVA